MILATTAPATASATDVRRSDFHWGHAAYGVSVVYSEPAEGAGTPEMPVICPVGDDGLQDTLPIRSEPRAEWDSTAAQRFNELAVKDAVDGLSGGEPAELEALARLRRQAVAPLTIEQMRFEYQRRHAVQAALKAFDEYFQLITAPRHARP